MLMRFDPFREVDRLNGAMLERARQRLERLNSTATLIEQRLEALNLVQTKVTDDGLRELQSALPNLKIVR